jgi:hypothetical protein
MSSLAEILATRRWLRRSLGVALVLAGCGVACCSGATAARASASLTAVASEATWILSAQQPDGAIPVTGAAALVSPYLANYAAAGLARASTLTGQPGYVLGAWRWLYWYQQHQSQRGFVTDYTVGPGVEQSTGKEDSTDAYAGTFLLAVAEAWRASRDLQRVQGLLPGITGAVAAIEATQDRDGLSWATPSFHVKYLMDQAEAYAGLRAAAGLAAAAGAPLLWLRSTLDAAAMQWGVAHLWNRDTAAYDWAVHPAGRRVATNWGLLYPDAMSQAWAVAFGFARGKRAVALMHRFAAAQPAWDSPTALLQFDTGEKPAGYWPVVGIALGAAGERLAGLRAGMAITRVSDMLGRAWPFTAASAGQLILLDGGGSLPPRLRGAGFGDAIWHALKRALAGIL